VQIEEIPADVGRYYAANYHGLPAPDLLPDHAVLEHDKVEIVRRATQGRRLVEIGPSFGAFAHAAKAAGFDVSAIEMDPECVAYLRSVVGIEAIESNEPENALDELPNPDAIVMWHVLEHLPDPVRMIRSVAAHLAPGGVFAVAVPNPDSLQFRTLGPRWAHLDAPRHVTLVAHAALVNAARSAGLIPLGTTTTDEFGRHCNRFGWEYALRRAPSRGASPTPVVRASQVLQKVLAPVESRALNGAAYTAVFRRPAA
jgi:2-polyprenyl-3-methyl-5-hydroxy-6-metoxy-1,4-benzoquinol methylase